MAVSISANPTVLVEEEGTVLTITLSSSEPIPEGGLVVTVDSETENALAQLDVFATEFENLRLVGVNDDTSGFSIRLTEQTGTLSLPIFDDDVADAIEGLTFTVQPGEGYTVDESANSISLTLQDAESTTIEPPSEVPDVPVDPIPSDNTPPVAQSDSYTVEAGEELSVDVDAGILSNDSDAEGNQLIVSVLDTPDSGNLSLNEDGSFSYTPNDGFSGTDTFTYLINDGEIFSEPATVEIVVDAATTPEPPTPPTGELPVVSASIEPDVVSEEDEGASFTLTLTVDGEIPTAELDADGAVISGGLPVLFDGTDVNPLFEQIAGDPIFDGAALGEFSDPEQPDLLEFVLLENTSSVTLNILNDVIQEEPQDLTFGILPDDQGLLDSNYTVNPDAASDTVTLVDDNGGAGVGPTVGLSISETELREGDEFTVNFNVDGEIPSDGLTVLVDSETPRVLGEFNLFDADGTPVFETTGIEGVPEVGDTAASSFLVNITEPEASISLSIFDDGANEGLEEVSFSLVDGEVYEVDSNAQQVAFSIDDSESGATTSPTFGTIEADVIEVEGSSQIVFGGDSDDLIDASIGSTGNNRIYAGSGDDTLILGSGDRLIGGEGDDKFFALSGGDNIITGGEGADQFWIATAEIPEAANIITDFTSGEDVLGIAGLGIGFDDLSITGQEDNTLIAANNSELAILQGIGADSLIADNFAFG